MRQCRLGTVASLYKDVVFARATLPVCLCVAAYSGPQLGNIAENYSRFRRGFDFYRSEFREQRYLGLQGCRDLHDLEIQSNDTNDEDIFCDVTMRVYEFEIETSWFIRSCSARGGRNIYLFISSQSKWESTTCIYKNVDNFTPKE